MARRKRYKNIYSRKKHRTSALQMILIIVGCLAVVLIGYAASGPVADLINGKLKYDPKDDQPSESVEQSSNSDNNSSKSSSDSDKDDENSVQVPNIQPKPSSDLSKVKGVYMPTSILLDDTLFNQFVKQTGEKGFINSIIFDVKDITGNVYYNSTNESVITAGAKVQNPVDLGARVSEMEKAGLRPIARIYAFQDSVASFVIPDSYVWYQSPGTRWVDNFIDKGGKPWLNPESVVAQEYIKGIATEIIGVGIKDIIVDGMTYPTGVALELAYYGERSKTDKIGVLSDFSKDLQKAVEQKGGTLILMNTATALLSDNPLQFGGNPINIDVSNISISIFPASLATPLEIGGQSVAAPATMPKEATSLVINTIKQQSSAKSKTILPFIQYYDGYENGDYAKQIEALEENGVQGYVLFNEQGIY